MSDQLHANMKGEPEQESPLDLRVIRQPPSDSCDQFAEKDNLQPDLQANVREDTDENSNSTVDIKAVVLSLAQNPLSLSTDSRMRARISSSSSYASSVVPHENMEVSSEDNLSERSASPPVNQEPKETSSADVATDKPGVADSHEQQESQVNQHTSQHPFSISAILDRANDNEASGDSEHGASSEAEVVHLENAWNNTVEACWYNYQMYTLAPSFSNIMAGGAGMADSARMMESARMAASAGMADSTGTTGGTGMAYWCHCCRRFLSGMQEAHMHNYYHVARHDACALKRETLKRHGYVTQHKYSDTDKLICSICNDIRTVSKFGQHQRAHNGHVCPICNKEFSSEIILKGHLNSHAGRTPYDCSYCSKQFPSRQARSQHERAHVNENRFVCNHCFQAFNRKFSLEVHVRRHTKDYPYKCEFPGCDKAYPQKVQLKGHINNHHR